MRTQLSLNKSTLASSLYHFSKKWIISEKDLWNFHPKILFFIFVTSVHSQFCSNQIRASKCFRMCEILTVRMFLLLNIRLFRDETIPMTGRDMITTHVFMHDTKCLTHSPTFFSFLVFLACSDLLHEMIASKNKRR